MSDEAVDDAVERDDLVRRARHDREAFGRLYDRYFPVVYRYCLRRLFVREAAEDAASEAFLQAAAHMPTFAGRTDADFRCFAAMSRAGGAEGVPDDQKAQLASGVMYFLGKLDGENPGLDLETALADQVTLRDLEQGQLFPPQGNILETEIKVASRVAKVVFDSNLASVEDPADCEAFIRSHVYKPEYRSLLSATASMEIER